ncbi:helix-turn-helix domain-containing protein [Clostridium thermobutyricum]|uniref:helix-turn-helix domain-containing protein n=1 Tax=Clostridium thermobutyricum TaxID=29372 RepID=UPI0018A8A78A|nr:helix-turn-helix transcriptional regulator [Clostridium thermobutyricum]
MVKCKIHLLMAEHRMTQKELSALTGIRPNTISGYYNDTFKLIDRNHLDKFCEVFNCKIEDLIEYTKDTEGES